MTRFNENLSTLFTEYRDDALLKLDENKEYLVLRDREDKLRTELEEKISSECKQLFENYRETVSNVEAMHLNIAFLCGVDILQDIKKRLDDSCGEYQEFVQEFV